MGTQEATIPCSRSLRHLAKYEDQAVGQRRSQGFAKGPIDFHDMVVQQICSASGTSLTVVGIYLDASIGLVGQNLVKLHTLAKLLSMVRGPWIVVGDWNATPQELAQIGYKLQRLFQQAGCVFGQALEGGTARRDLGHLSLCG